MQKREGKIGPCVSHEEVPGQKARIRSSELNELAVTLDKLVVPASVEVPILLSLADNLSLVRGGLASRGNIDSRVDPRKGAADLEPFSLASGQQGGEEF